jgi:glutathione S-transferase
MTLKLYFHPIASYCWKALIALYENDTPFEKVLVDLGNAQEREAFAKVWPIAKFPVLRDDARGRTVAESSVIIEYLAQYYPGPSQLVPEDPELRWEMRMRDRFFDGYVNDTMAKMVADQIRPPGKTDPFGVDQAITLLETAYAMLDEDVKARNWAVEVRSGKMASLVGAPPTSHRLSTAERLLLLL